MESIMSCPLPMAMEHDNAKSKGEVIHSGHFMISSVADQDEVDDDVSHDRDSPVHHDQAIRLKEGYDFSEVRKETQNTYQFGHRSTNQITIDASLARLFECMSLAYRGGKVVSPKWKNFKGMRLSVKDKIRLNNAIWRTWHIQYIMKRKRNNLSFVQFATPLDNESDCDSHSKPEAVVMEGKYWKRRIETVVAEYKKWRAFFMDKLQQSDHPGLTWVSNQSPSTPESISNNMDALMRADDNMFADLADRLFRGMSQPFPFPNPREIAQHATNSDMMQPGLLQLQPPIDDFMDPLDTLQDIFSPTRKSPNMNGSNNSVSLFSVNNVHSSVAQLDFPTPMFTQQDFEMPGMQESSLEELVQRATVGHDMMLVEDFHRMSQPRQQQATVSPQQNAPMQVQPANNYGVSDPMMNKPSHEQMFGQVQTTAIPRESPLLISKQQQETPTISHVVVSRQQQHHHPQQVELSIYDGMNQNKTTNIMPPPQKAPPRRRFAQKAAAAPVPNVVAVPVQVMPRQTKNASVPMIVNYTHAPALNSGQEQQLGQAKFASDMQQVVIPSHMAVTAHSLMPQQQQVQDPWQMQNMQTVEPAQQGIVISNMHMTNSQGRNGSTPVSKEVSSSSPALIIPITVSQAIPNQFLNDSGQPLQKKTLLVGQTGNPSIVVKQPSQTMLNSQHIATKQQTLLTQLLTTGRQDNSKSPAQLQMPLNVVLAPARETQLKQVRDQAANFNTFQNSVLMAAAQMATSPQMQQSVQSQDGNNAASASLSAIVDSRRNEPSKPFVSMTRPKVMSESVSKVAKPAWGLSTATRVVTMDTDEDASRPKDDFVNEMEEKSYGESAVTATGDQRSHQISAEQKRRCNIKSLCDRLQEILPEISSHPNQKVSKALLLSKSCNHIRRLQSTRQQTASEIQKLKKKIAGLNEDICNFQQQLPATGAPVSKRRGDRMKIAFDDWVRDRTLNEWKFFIFSMIVKPWFLSFDETVSDVSMDELCRTSLMWLDRHCSLLTLRRGVVDSLQELGTSTNILSDPGTLQQQAEDAVQQSSRRCSNS